jgi:hypothetical protein
VNTSTNAPTNSFQQNQMAAMRGQRQLKTVVGVLLAGVMIMIIVFRLRRNSTSIFNKRLWHAAEQIVLVSALAGLIALLIL